MYTIDGVEVAGACASCRASGKGEHVGCRPEEASPYFALGYSLLVDQFEGNPGSWVATLRPPTERAQHQPR